jgi:acetylornithine deacetylase/succinyl-diaminopimelate desuccinylase-like protein
MLVDASTCARITQAIDRQRLVDTAVRLVSIPSRTGEAGAAADCFSALLAEHGFTVERHAGGHPAAPAVAARLAGSAAGPTLQFDGHLDTVHLPFVAPTVGDGRITGSGAADMKAGLAAAVEALRALQDTSLLSAGSVLLTAHDLHEAPWGLGQQLNSLIAEGLCGDAVLLPESFCDHLPIGGRGAGTWKATIRRAGPPFHEVNRPGGTPSVINAGATLVQALRDLNHRLAAKVDALAGGESVFVGQFHAGEIYNQDPSECWLEGTRRWIPDTALADVKDEFARLVAAVEDQTGTSIATDFVLIRDAFRLKPDPLLEAFQAAYRAVCGVPLPLGPKAFVDDGNSFWSLARVAAITHGPRAGGQHTLTEWVSIDDLVRVAQVYALTAVAYCGGDDAT